MLRNLNSIESQKATGSLRRSFYFACPVNPLTALSGCPCGWTVSRKNLQKGASCFLRAQTWRAPSSQCLWWYSHLVSKVSFYLTILLLSYYLTLFYLLIQNWLNKIFCSVCKSIPDPEFVLQEAQEPRQWLSLRATSLCLKGTPCRWSAAIRILGVLCSSGTSSTPDSASSYSWKTPQERASRVSPLSSAGLRHPSIWKNPRLGRKTQLCITVLWVTQYLASQEKQSANPLRKAFPCSLFDHRGALSL